LPRLNTHISCLFRVNVWNQCASSLTGFSTDDVFGRKLVEDFVSSDYKESVSDILKNALMGIETANFEFPLLTSGDHVVEVLLNATTRRDAQDKVIGVVGIGQDITGKIILIAVIPFLSYLQLLTYSQRINFKMLAQSEMLK